MAMRRHLGGIVVAGVWAAWGTAVCVAQSAPANPPNAGPAPCSVAPEPVPCSAKPAATTKPGTAEKFPFPGDVSGASSGAQGADPAPPNLSGVPQAPDISGAPSAPLGRPDTSKALPFPGEPGKMDSSTNAPGTSSSSNSGDDDASPADPGAAPSGAAPGLEDKGSEGNSATPGRHLLHRVNPIGTKLQSTDEREAEDLDVAHTYADTGDLQGAYMRTQDAVKIAPDDPDAHFALAEVALKLKKRDVAIAEYNACLKLSPSDKEAKDARKALARLRP